MMFLNFLSLLSSLNYLMLVSANSRCVCGKAERQTPDKAFKRANDEEKRLIGVGEKVLSVPIGKIVGGYQQESQPWYAAFHWNYNVVCGGAVINHRYIV